MSHHEPGGQSRTTQSSKYTPDRLDQRPVKPSKTWYNIGMLVFGILFIAALSASGANFARLAEFPANFANYSVLMVQGVFQPLTPEVLSDWQAALDGMLESVMIAWIGTIVGALFSLPMGVLAARNLTPLPIYVVVRFILSVIRAVPEIIFAIALMLPIFGLGPLAGALALGVSSIGTLSKLISESIEAVDEGPLESANAAGSNKPQMIRWAILPQVMPEVIAIWLYRFEVNIRASAILGVLGAGGIGSLLSALFNVREWDRIGITLVVIVVVTVIIDQISAWIRHRVIHGAPGKPDQTDDDGQTGPQGPQPAATIPELGTEPPSPRIPG
jgi:phosphonate transport system permease protein